MTLNEKVNTAVHIWRETQDREWLENAIITGRLSHSMGGSCYNLACALALAGETDEAFDLLEKAIENNQIAWTYVHGAEEQPGDPDWDDFRDHPRYVELMKRFREK